MANQAFRLPLALFEHTRQTGTKSVNGIELRRKGSQRNGAIRPLLISRHDTTVPELDHKPGESRNAEFSVASHRTLQGAQSIGPIAGLNSVSLVWTEMVSRQILSQLSSASGGTLPAPAFLPASHPSPARSFISGASPVAYHHRPLRSGRHAPGLVRRGAQVTWQTKCLLMRLTRKRRAS